MSLFKNLLSTIPVVGGFFAADRLRGAGRAARDVARLNAGEMLALAGQNAARLQGIAGINASAVHNIGYANAAAMERTAVRNAGLIMVEGAETLRRHVRAEQYQIGLTRVTQSPSGWNVNTGTPRAYVGSEKKEMMESRKFTVLQQKMSLFTMLANTKDQAYVARYTADQNQNAILATAEIEADIALAEAQARYNAMLREGDLAFLQGANAADAAIVKGFQDTVRLGLTIATL